LANDVVKIIPFEKPVYGVFSNKNVEGILKIQ
jgi:hypothetical protein